MLSQHYNLSFPFSLPLPSINTCSLSSLLFYTENNLIAVEATFLLPFLSLVFNNEAHDFESISFSSLSVSTRFGHIG